MDSSCLSSDALEWSGRCEYWRSLFTANSPRRKRRDRAAVPLILCGHGLSIRVERNTLLIRDGKTHYPAAERTWRFFKGSLELPPRIVVVDGSGEITLDALGWLAEQTVSLITLKWDGSSLAVTSPTGYSAEVEKVAWQRSTFGSPKARLKSAIEIVTKKLHESVRTLEACFPDAKERSRTIKSIQYSISQLERGRQRFPSDVLGIEGRAAARYFALWSELSIRWKGLMQHPIPDDWRAYWSRSSLVNTPATHNRNASHPVNAMLNYGYAILHRHVQIQAIADGYDPTIGILHKPRFDRHAFVLDLMEPMRPVVDRAILGLIASETFTGRDFQLQSNGICRLNPQLARRVVQRVDQSLEESRCAVDQGGS